MARDKVHHPLDRDRYPVDEWRLRELSYEPQGVGAGETLFSVANGYLGLRGNPEEGREAVAHGTFINGFHETWEIRHAEAAFGFARTGQTIVNVPDAKVIKLYVDDEPLVLGVSELESYERVLDMREGVLRRKLVWRTPSGKRVRVESTRMVSMEQRHLAVMTFEVTMLTGSAPVVLSSQLINRQDGLDDFRAAESSADGMSDPRKAGAFEGRVLMPRVHGHEDGRLVLGYQCQRSKMTMAAAVEHRFTGVDDVEVVLRAGEDQAKAVHRFDLAEGECARLEKYVAYHSSKGVPVSELSDRCDRTLDRALRYGLDRLETEQKDWFEEFWRSSDVVVGADAEVQQAIRFNLFCLAQAAGRTDGGGIAAKGVTGSGYEGHYFWDTEIYVVPFLTYTQPGMARNALHFRRRMLPAARIRAGEMAQSGALFPWRTINGEEASAYYAAGSAQMHINGDVVYALMKYVTASGDTEFLAEEGVDLLVETARMWRDLGFWRSNGNPTFHIHGVTGPDEYTTVVNNNLFTNLMARFNLRSAALVVERLREKHPAAHRAMVHRLHVQPDEVEEWMQCAEGMHVPFDEGLGIHPQDDFFLDREVWDLSRTPKDLRPLLLHYHPLVIYRFQVLKQADVVLALFLHGDLFTPEEKKADFEYYDPITTGDSTLSAVVQSIVAAEVGYHEVAMDYFWHALHTDLGDLHHNTVDGIHVASAGGVWSALVFGFAGLRDHEGKLSFDPRLPVDWDRMQFRLAWHGSRLGVDLSQDTLKLSIVEGDGPVDVTVRGKKLTVTVGEPVEVPLDHQGERINGLLDKIPHTGGVRSDGTRITSGVPDPVITPEHNDPYAAWTRNEGLIDEV
ncbi:glycoside hydrolase family 65 protein [Nocardioides daphniae]|uniref:Glycoside hydrolase family 65 protein n=1 Tax=Nocardioides daphniae TaxID=402297 RepID=A0A4P7UEI0_9ACTN|nr:glycosyl hydrolase family 65 protein [Nocardioides daphniae]QCC78314.1 glycoside hydrolase family 65 protein [Nocardioides daphniae]GGD13634.1 kojibiose phosphorylase [Nocardioides daphniae]